MGQVAKEKTLQNFYCCSCTFYSKSIRNC